MRSGIKTDRFEEKIARFISLFVSNNPFGASDLASLAFLLAVFSHQKLLHSVLVCLRLTAGFSQVH